MSALAGRVIVIGGGVIGTACSHFLSRSGWGVTLIERGAFGKGSSGSNCGFVCPSHVLPLAEPGAAGAVLKALLRKNSPLAVKLRFDPALWSWFWGFARRCNKHDMIDAGRGIQALLEESMTLYRELVEREALDCEWQTRGLLFVYRTPSEMEKYAETDKLLRDSFHCPATRYEGDALLALEPALNPGLAGGWYYEDDAHLRPDKLLKSWRRALEASGVKVLENCALRGFVRESGRARAIETSQGELTADAYVVAAGALTPLLSRDLGCRIPIQPGKGYTITMPRPASCPTVPLIFPETRVAVTPFQSGYRLGSTMEFAGYDASINRSRLQLLKDGAQPYLREPYCEPVQEEWFGWRPMTFDGLPIIDRSPVMENVIIAAGHNMLGLSMAPATGKLVTALLARESPSIDPAPYRVARFEK
ncbi:MAG TPA: FAD-dependent oxidoreductase [Isosphaeraceae bacterium]|jgi:D-amino-acid dehydrogenase|nr:FAD-dependent oxidoreductase [Isosphaeraceae bacterium]